MPIKNSNNLVIAIVVLCVVVAGLLYLQFSGNSQFLTRAPKVSPEKAAELALVYINENIFGGRAQAQLAGEVQEEAGLYKFEVKVGEEKFFSYVSKDGKIFFPQGIDLKENAQQPQEGSQAEVQQGDITVGDFSVTQNEICKENGKPLIYFFGADFCPHCQWEHPIVQKVAESFEGYISFHDNMDTDKEMDIFNQYSTGGIPTAVLGCRYFRVGSGESDGEEQEIENLTKLICDLTNGQPAEVCK